MAFVSFADDAAMYDATAFENMFIIEYMPTAPEGFLKVYMYARMLCLHPELGGLEELQRALNMDEETISNAFLYWERAGLVYRSADNPPQYRFRSLRMGSVNDYDRDYYKYRDFNGALQALFGGDKMVHPAQYALANDWLNVLGFSQEAVISLVKHMIAASRSQNPDPARIFKAADKKAAKLADSGITDLEGVEREFSRDAQAEHVAQTVARQFGFRRRPTQPELELASKWMREWNYTLDDIISACADTVKAQNPSFGYLDSILKNRRNDDPAYDAMRRVFAALGTHQTPTEEHIKWYARQLEEGFEPQTIEFAAAQQARRKNASLMGLEKLLNMWALRALFKRVDAEKFVETNRALYVELAELMHSVGVERTFSEAEVNTYASWKQLISDKLIAHAATKAATKRAPIEYMANMIARWHKAGINTVEEAEAMEARPEGGARDKQNPALDYEQRDYSDDDFNGDLFMDEVEKYMARNDESN